MKINSYKMDEIKEDVLKYWTWAQKEFKGEDIDRLRFEVESAVTNLNRYINNEFRRKAMGKTDMRSK
ncbi:hypothetical protein OAF04_05875 [Flavobacteriaceae bacterium]|nr:hypothetical protein [Flavobacteriaceae bacterium]